MVSNTPDQKQIGEDISEESTSKEDFIHQTEEIKKIISEGQCTKIVLSKVRMEDKKSDFNPVKLFEKLCSIYPHAFVSFLQLPGTGCWIGASPEPLLEVLENSAHTVSLAGSQKTKDVSKKDISWGKKEVEEQAIVTNYIEDVILKLKIFSYKLQGPFTYTAGNLVHLRTSFSFRKSEVENCMGDLLSGLHPTPSVCGLPKKESMDFLQKLEKHKRSYYAGFLGSLNMDNETHLFVNLRCLKVGENDLALYAGAGITSGSNPAKEWDETEEKLKTLLTVIN
jgi:isochorismate synthase